MAFSYFKNIFLSNASASPGSASQGIEPTVSSEDNSLILQPFTGEEVRNVLFSMHPTKSSGPDGMSTLFFQKHCILSGTMFALLFWIFLMALFS